MVFFPFLVLYTSIKIMRSRNVTHALSSGTLLWTSPDIFAPSAVGSSVSVLESLEECVVLQVERGDIDLRIFSSLSHYPIIEIGFTPRSKVKVFRKAYEIRMVATPGLRFLREFQRAWDKQLESLHEYVVYVCPLQRQSTKISSVRCLR